MLAVWKLDRLGRSPGQLIVMIDGIGKAGAGFQSLSECIDTTTAGGRLIFHVMGALKFEHSLIGERTKAGMQAAKRRGKALSRPRKLSSSDCTRARALIETGEETRSGLRNCSG